MTSARTFSAMVEAVLSFVRLSGLLIVMSSTAESAMAEKFFGTMIVLNTNKGKCEH